MKPTQNVTEERWLPWFQTCIRDNVAKVVKVKPVGAAADLERQLKEYKKPGAPGAAYQTTIRVSRLGNTLYIVPVEASRIDRHARELAEEEGGP